MIWLYIKLAWRNVFRNKRRSFIAGTAIGIGLASLIFTDALIIGMKDNMISSATGSFLGEAQIHARGFRETREVGKTINELSWIEEHLKSETIIEHFTPRVLAFAMISSPTQVAAIQLVGIQPETEKHVSMVDEAMYKGHYLNNDSARQAVLGKALADQLDVTINDRVVITVSEVGTGDLSQEMFRIAGVYRFNNDQMDKGLAFIPLKCARDMIAVKGVHEIAITFTDRAYARDDSLTFWNTYSQYGNKALSWTDLMPQLHAALQITDFSTLIVAIMLFGVVALGIMNTLFMSLHERMFEFGVLRAVGTKPLSIAQLIFFESVVLALLSSVIGVVLGFAITFVLSQTGIDYTGIEFAGVTFQHLLYPVFDPGQYVMYPLWVLVFTLIAGIYPAVYAAKIKPARAMQKIL